MSESTPEKAGEAQPAQAPRRMRTLKAALMLLAGAAAALAVWTFLPGGAIDPGPEAQGPASPAGPAGEAGAEPLAATLTSRELLDMAGSAEREGRRHDALRLLESGLERCGSENPAFRAVFFERLASVYEKLGRRSASEMLRANALRLAKEANGVGFQLDLARESGRTGDRRGEQRALHRLLLVTSGQLEEEGEIAAAARRALARSLDAEWESLLSEPVDTVPEPSLKFEGTR